MYVKLTGVKVSNVHETIKPSDLFGGGKPGSWVAVRPCDPELQGKTFLGMYLCSAPTGVIGHQDGETMVLTMTDYCNPAIYIPELDRIVWGYGSWWGAIKSPDDLKDITDADIENVFYVRALRELAESVAATEAPE